MVRNLHAIIPIALALSSGPIANLSAETIAPSFHVAAVGAPTTVQGAHVDIVAQWNESNSATGRYQAPQGFVIKSARPVVQSELRSSSHVTVSADQREASLSVTVRGKGEFWNKERGWFQGYLNIELAPIE